MSSNSPPPTQPASEHAAHSSNKAQSSINAGIDESIRSLADTSLNEDAHASDPHADLQLDKKVPGEYSDHEESSKTEASIELETTHQQGSALDSSEGNYSGDSNSHEEHEEDTENQNDVTQENAGYVQPNATDKEDKNGDVNVSDEDNDEINVDSGNNDVPVDDDNGDDDNEEDDDDDFGSFDDASFDDFEEAEKEEDAEDSTKLMSYSSPASSHVQFDESTFKNTQSFEKNLGELMDQAFPNIPEVQQTTDDHDNQELLDVRSRQIFDELSAIQYLQPPNWVKSKIRHNLLIKLGIPVNLDEISSKSPHSNNQQHQADSDHLLSSNHLPTPGRGHARRKSVKESDINWAGFEVPDTKDLQLSPENKLQTIENTNDILSKIEKDNLNNSSRQFLESMQSGDALDAKLKSFTENYNTLLTLSSIWQDQLRDRKSNFEVYESVVQNLIGYSQRLRRDEIFENLNKVKSKSKKNKRKSFWR